MPTTGARRDVRIAFMVPAAVKRAAQERADAADLKLADVARRALVKALNVPIDPADITRPPTERQP